DIAMVFGDIVMVLGDIVMVLGDIALNKAKSILDTRFGFKNTQTSKKKKKKRYKL
ncbi:MAG: hypothetical protein IPN94_10590, partial [Sphingobacteriales bacterium]|nr:hypothetical protein [Sphingobacteriales bacterium]